MSIYSRHGRAARLALLMGSTAVRMSGRADRGPSVLCYHRVPARDRARFAEQMAAIAPRAISLREAEKGRPGVAVTFDDGYADLLDTVLPVLRTHRVPATIYIVAGNLGRPPAWSIDPAHPDAAVPLVNETQLRELAADPLITIGAHTMTHPRLTAIPAEAAEAEIADSKAAIEAIIGEPVIDFAFPHGAWNDRLCDFAHAAGLSRLALLHGPRRKGVMPRRRMEPDAWSAEFRLTVDGAYAWRHRLRAA